MQIWNYIYRIIVDILTILDYIMKLKIKDDITSTFVKTLNQATKYCNISEKTYSYPISVITLKH
jgi:hypothetical protein